MTLKFSEVVYNNLHMLVEEVLNITLYSDYGMTYISNHKLKSNMLR